MSPRLRALLPWIAPALIGLWALASLRVPSRADGLDLAGFAALPVLTGGRVKPLDTVGRTGLLMMRGTQSLRADGRTVGPVEWLLDMTARPAVADAREVFLVDDPETRSVAGIGATDRRRFSFKELEPKLGAVDEQAGQAEAVPSGSRTMFQAAVVGLRDRLVLYRRLQNSLQPAGVEDFTAELAAYEKVLRPGVKAVQSHQSGSGFNRKALAELGVYFNRYRFLATAAEFRPLPPRDGEPADAWRSMGEGLLEAMRDGRVPADATVWARLLGAWRAGDAAAFNAALAEHRAWLHDHRPREERVARSEALFNRIAPFYRGMIAYVVAFLLAFAAWLGRPDVFRRAGWNTLMLAWAIHTLGMFARIVLQGRPPVTNLYSSAVYVGWAAAGLGLLLERRARNGIGIVAASTIGFATLLIAHHLAAQGDSMEMMRAVLDSNFWLATHVVAVTTGYAATFLAGALGCWYLLRGAFSRTLDARAAAELERLAFGVVCFALFFSFTGTVLGGIWADQSWGRFWGWDPKENGAFLIVLWNAIILHVRWARLAGERGIMAMTVVGNIITALSWFGVNMLGIGLHSYGFMDKAFWWLAAFVLTQLAIAAIGLAPDRWWRGRLSTR